MTSSGKAPATFSRFPSPRRCVLSASRRGGGRRASAGVPSALPRPPCSGLAEPRLGLEAGPWFLLRCTCLQWRTRLRNAPLPRLAEERRCGSFAPSPSPSPPPPRSGDLPPQVRQLLSGIASCPPSGRPAWGPPAPARLLGRLPARRGAASGQTVPEPSGAGPVGARRAPWAAKAPPRAPAAGQGTRGREGGALEPIPRWAPSPIWRPPPSSSKGEEGPRIRLGVGGRGPPGPGHPTRERAVDSPAPGSVSLGRLPLSEPAGAAASPAEPAPPARPSSGGRGGRRAGLRPTFPTSGASPGGAPGASGRPLGGHRSH